MVVVATEVIHDLDTDCDNYNDPDVQSWLQSFHDHYTHTQTQTESDIHTYHRSKSGSVTWSILEAWGARTKYSKYPEVILEVIFATWSELKYYFEYDFVLEVSQSNTLSTTWSPRK